MAQAMGSMMGDQVGSGGAQRMYGTERDIDSCYETYYITRDEKNSGLILAWRLQNSN